MKRVPAGPGQESVWDYPRPPRLELSSRHVRVVLAGTTIAETSRAYRVMETSHPPNWYLPPEDIDMRLLTVERKTSHCEWKGAATYWTVAVPGHVLTSAAWSYQQPSAPFSSIRGYLAFYPGRLECFVDDERVIAQPGEFYGGWITRDLVGPFKGAPGTWNW